MNVETGKVEYLEVRTDERVYGVAVNTKTENSKGIDVASEERSRTDGWEAARRPPTTGSTSPPLLRITYVADSQAKTLDESALLAVNDLGPSGETWSLNSLSYSGGVITTGT